MPDINEFKWTDELVKEYISKFGISQFNTAFDHAIQEFKKSKEKDIPKQDWEIMEIKCYGGEIMELIDGEYRLFVDGIGFDGDYLLNRDGSKIHSVKRLTDGGVFSIGDTAKLATIMYRGVPPFTITDFYMDGDFLFVNRAKGRWNIMALQKQKKSLFTTEDGVEIFEGDRVWWVNLVPLIDIERYSIDSYDFEKHCGQDDLCHHPDKYKYFSTEQKAIDWLLVNKPIQISLNELKDFCDNEHEAYTYRHRVELFFQSKINL